MNWKRTEDVLLQVTVGQLAVSSPFPKQDIHVSINVSGVSKSTCSGELSEDGLNITWNHPFLFSAPPSATMEASIFVLPEEFTFEWAKQPFGGQVVTSVGNLLRSDNVWQCNVPGLSSISATLFITCNPSDGAIVLDGHDCLSSFETTRLYNFGWQLKNLSLVSTQIELDLARLDLCPSSQHAAYTGILNSLANSFSFCYDQKGNIADLNKAVEFSQARLHVCPLGHSKHAEALGFHAMFLQRYHHLDRYEDHLNKLIEMEQGWLDWCSSDDIDYQRVLGLLASSLWDRYNRQGSIADLNRAIEMAEERHGLYPIGHHGRHATLQCLSVYLGGRYKKLDALADLNRAIDLQEEGLELYTSQSAQGVIFQNLASLLWNRYRKMHTHSDLMRAIKLLKETLNIYPIQHHNFASSTSNLARIILFASASAQNHSLDQQLPSSDEAFQLYRQLKMCGPAVSLSLLEAIQDWVKNAEKYNHPSVSEAYQTLLSSVEHFNTLHTSLDSRHKAMQTRMTNLANNVFSCVTRHGDLQMAVELLERGKEVLWSQLFRPDRPMIALEGSKRGYKLQRKFTQLSADLRDYDTHWGVDEYQKLQEQWQSIVDKIRDLDGFSRFLLPLRFEDLQQAAEYGPVIIMNASEYACDALIVLHGRLPVHVPLPCSLEDVDHLCSQWSELARGAHAYGTQKECWTKQMLRDVWSSVVERITSVLQNDVQLPLGSRIWWCPTSSFAMLPFHAAGPYRRSEKNLVDMYVSSYTTSLSALLRAHHRVRSRRIAPSTSTSERRISFAAIGQGRSADTRLAELPEAEHDIERIRNETGMPPNVTFKAITGSAATIEGAMQAFRDHHWVHVACHGARHTEKPFESWFAMRDGKLTLERILRERDINCQFVFLSACHGAAGDVVSPDKVIHLAAGLQYAGVEGVIRTLWKVDEASAHHVITRFYREMFNRPVIGSENAAMALNTTVVETASEALLAQQIAFVHFGI